MSFLLWTNVELKNAKEKKTTGSPNKITDGR